MGIATVLAFAGMGGAWSAYRQRLPSPEPLERARPLWNLFDQKWYLEQGYHALFVRGGTWLAGVLAGPVDQKGVDRALVGIGSLVALTGEGLAPAPDGLRALLCPLGRLGGGVAGGLLHGPVRGFRNHE